MSTEKNIKVTFDPDDQSFRYSGDIDRKEVIRIEHHGEVPIQFHLRGAAWADEPVRWLDERKRPCKTPKAMKVRRRSDKLVQVLDDCCPDTKGHYRFELAVKVDGDICYSDPTIANDPLDRG